MTEQKPFDIHDFIAIGLRRKWYILIPLILCVLISYGVYKYLPKVYQASTLILVQPQRVPESYVRPTVTETVASRLNTISQEILSRTRLEQVIQEFNLYTEIRNKAPMEGIVEMMRKAIEVKVLGSARTERDQNSFSISYEGKDPRIVMMVTNKLASLFIEENLKVRELRAEGTSEFIAKELAAVEEQLKKKESDIRLFRERNMGQLPQQLDANLRILERVQDQLKTTSENIRTAEDRRMVIQSQIEMLKKREPPQTSREVRRDPATGQETLTPERIPEDPQVTQLNLLKRELGNALAKYRETHPDVIDLRKRIAGLEPKVQEILEKQEAEREARLRTNRARQNEVVVENLPAPAPDLESQRLFTQYTEQYNASTLEAKRLREEEKELKQQILLYQRRIEDTPRREQELLLLTRDYDLMKANYQSLLDKRIQAQMAENLERKQQGEQFKVLDPARVPVTPVRPDRNRILLFGLAIGLGVGGGLAWLKETMDRSFKTVSEVETELGLPVLAAIPNLKKEIKKAA
jgi:polysaccharide chain length determinant protein (PEP-CTERM system associated)